MMESRWDSDWSARRTASRRSRSELFSPMMLDNSLKAA